MSEQVNRSTQAVIEAVIGGNAVGLAGALNRLACSSSAEFLRVTGQLLDTRQPETVPVFGFGACGYGAGGPFYHADSHVFGATYTEGHWLMTRKVHPAGIGLPYEAVKEIVIKARAEYDETVLKKAIELKGVLIELDSLLGGHSFADSKLTSLAHVELFKGQALLLAALNPIKRD